MYPKNKQLAMNNIESNAPKGLKTKLRIEGLLRKGNKNKNNMLANKHKTPDNLSGIDLKIA